eukprot:1346221-Amorphochlora_amoeboformis.AAC.1
MLAPPTPCATSSDTTEEFPLENAPKIALSKEIKAKGVGTSRSAQSDGLSTQNVEKEKQNRNLGDPHAPYRFAEWYPKVISHCPKAGVLRLPVALVRYLGEDGIVLPNPQANTDAFSSDEDEEGWDTVDNSQPELPEEIKKAMEEIDHLVEKIGGESGVFPKLNGISPLDA